MQQAVDAVAEHGTVTAAATALSIPRATLSDRYTKAVALNLVATLPDRAVFPEFPDDDLGAEEILDHMHRRFDQRLAHDKALKWFDIKLPDNKPVGLAVVGDPHLGSNGCNIPLLRHDVALMRDTPGVLPVNIGDTVDNWGGRLVHLYSENDVSRQTERRLARWFLEAIPWICWLQGNHDMMNMEFATFLKAINANQVPMLDWQAKFQLVFPSKTVCRVDAAHNFKGVSYLNPLHGQKRNATWHGAEMADIHVSGHHHIGAISQEETEDGRLITLGRARGYKFIDSFAKLHGYADKQHGSTLMFVIDPMATVMVQPFMDLAAGCKYLTSIRG